MCVDPEQKVKKKYGKTGSVNKMTPFAEKLKELGLTGYKFSKLTGQCERTVYDWASGKYPAPPVVYWGIEEYKKNHLIKSLTTPAN